MVASRLGIRSSQCSGRTASHASRATRTFSGSMAWCAQYNVENSKHTEQWRTTSAALPQCAMVRTRCTHVWRAKAKAALWRTLQVAVAVASKLENVTLKLPPRPSTSWLGRAARAAEQRRIALQQVVLRCNASACAATGCVCIDWCRKRSSWSFNRPVVS